VQHLRQGCAGAGVSAADVGRQELRRAHAAEALHALRHTGRGRRAHGGSERQAQRFIKRGGLGVGRLERHLAGDAGRRRVQNVVRQAQRRGAEQELLRQTLCCWRLEAGGEHANARDAGCFCFFVRKQ